VVEYGHDEVGCGWVGGGSIVLWGLVCERSLVGESTGDFLAFFLVTTTRMFWLAQSGPAD